MPSFDIVCKVDPQELDNAINQARKELVQRYDLKDTASEVLLDGKQIVITSADDFKIKAVLDILQSKLVKRGISLKAFEYGNIESTLQGRVKQVLKIQEGIPTEKAHEIVKSIKKLNLRVQNQIQGDQLRISAKNIDDLQTVIKTLRSNDHGIHMDFVNMKRES
jgi:hypothetical protein